MPISDFPSTGHLFLFVTIIEDEVGGYLYQSWIEFVFEVMD